MIAHEKIEDWSRVAWTGSRYVDVLAPKPEDIVLREVAVGLSRQIRYGCHATREPWPVSKHSLLCVHFAEEDGVTDRRMLRTILMHDGPEYILGDMIAPVKNFCPEFRAIEETWWQCFCTRFHLYPDSPVTRSYDMLALGSEKQTLVSPGAKEWPFVPPGREIPLRFLHMTVEGSAREFARKVEELLPAS